MRRHTLWLERERRPKSGCLLQQHSSPRWAGQTTAALNTKTLRAHNMLRATDCRLSRSQPPRTRRNGVSTEKKTRYIRYTPCVSAASHPSRKIAANTPCQHHTLHTQMWRKHKTLVYPNNARSENNHFTQVAHTRDCNASLPVKYRASIARKESKYKRSNSPSFDRGDLDDSPRYQVALDGGVKRLS